MPITFEIIRFDLSVIQSGVSLINSLVRKFQAINLLLLFTISKFFDWSFENKKLVQEINIARHYL